MFALIRNFVRVRHASARVIQNSMYRTRKATMLVQSLRDAKKRHEEWRQHMRNEHDGVFARRIQSIIRKRTATKFVVKKRADRLLHATANIQRFMRGKIARSRYNHYLSKVIVIQSVGRRRSVYHNLHPLLIKRKKSSIKIQSMARSMFAKMKVAKKRELHQLRQERIRVAKEREERLRLEEEKRNALAAEK